MGAAQAQDAAIRQPFAWVVVAAGALVATIAGVLLVGPGVVLLRSGLTADWSRSDRLRMMVLWVAVGVLVSAAVGGWGAAWAAGRDGGTYQGFVLAAVLLVGIVVVGAPWVARRTNVRDVGIALGVVDAPNVGVRASEALQRLVGCQGGDPDGEPAAEGWVRVRRAAWYAGALGVGVVAAATLGTLGARGWRVGGAVGVGAIALGMAGLTFWLWPDLHGVYIATFDGDRSAGPDLGVNLSEVAQHPEVMWGETVTISGRVDRTLGGHALLLGNDLPMGGNRVLVVGDRPLDELVLLAEATIDQGGVAQVKGVVRPFDLPALEARLGVDLDDAAVAGYGGKAVLVARSIDLDVPVAAETGDKEFPFASGGYDLGVTIDDVVSRPEDYLGQTVTVSGEVEENLLSPHAFVLGDQALLAVSAKPRPELFMETTAYATGEVRRFNLAEIERAIGVDLEDERFEPFRGRPVIVVESVVLVR